jgi:hypothetical protein
LHVDVPPSLILFISAVQDKGLPSTEEESLFGMEVLHADAQGKYPPVNMDWSSEWKERGFCGIDS